MEAQEVPNNTIRRYAAFSCLLLPGGSTIDVQ